MSHSPEAKMVCPNCGYSAVYNYCARCGQETHLHSDTFWGLIKHFTAHYFHYDSKFWNTLKTLYIQPGALTIAYWNKQRRRFIDPISLYIFISAVFFLIYFFVKDYRLDHQQVPIQEKVEISSVLANSPSGSYWVKIQEVVNDPAKLKIVKKQVAHAPHKLFFFMIPFMAMLLGILSDRNKTFSDHAVFALHIHSFCFPIFLLVLIPGAEAFENWIQLITIVYLVLAIHKAYGLSWARAALYGLIIALSYIFLFVILQMALMVYYILSLA